MSNLTINANSIYDRVIHIGRQTENLVSEITFNLNMWIEKYGLGECVLNVRRNGDESAYLVPMTITDGMTTWTITDIDTAREGRGKIQLFYTVGEKVKTSPIFLISCGESLIGEGEPPSEYDSWLSELNRMTAKVEAVKTSVDANAQTASMAAVTAMEGASEAEQSATMASRFAINASTSATNASASAQAASQSAQSASVARTVAEAAATSAKAEAEDAEAAKTAAEQAKMNARISEQTASEMASKTAKSAADAKEHLQIAMEKAVESAQSSNVASAAATTATEKAALASQLATTANESAISASTSALAAAQSETLANQSANIAEAAKQAAQTAESNAHGFTQTASEKASQAAESASQAQVSVTDAQAEVAKAKAEADRAKTYADRAAEVELEIPTKVSQLENDAGYLTEHQSLADYIRKDVLYNMLPTDTASGAVASFADGADDIPLKSLVVGIDPVQSGEGDPSPDNVRPITGWTGANITTCGKNILMNTARPHTVNHVTYNVNADGIITANGTATKGNGRCDILNVSNPSKALLDAFSGKKLAGCPKGGGTKTYLIQLIIDGVVICRDTGSGIQIPDLSQYYGASNLYVDASVRTNHTAENLVFKPMISEDASYGAYEPYSGESIPISWKSEARTVYGGSLDVTNGVLTVTKGFIQSYNGEALQSAWISDRDVYADKVTPTTGAEVCYGLAEPVTYQLSAHEVKSLLGSNTIYADTGDTSVTYRADIQKWMEKS